MTLPIVVCLVALLCNADAGMRKSVLVPLSSEEVARIQTAVRAIRTKIQILGAELKTMREVSKINDPDTERMVPLKPADESSKSGKRYLLRKAEYLVAKAEKEELENRLAAQ